MKRSDWIGLTVSLTLHVLLLGLFSFMSVGASEPEALGYVEVEFGEWTEGRAVEESVETPVEEEQETEAEAQPETQQQEAPQANEPVDLPDEPVVDEEKVSEPEDDAEADPAPSAPQPEAPATTSGAMEGEGGASQGEQGTGDDEEHTSPFQIEGLNRVPRYTPNPDYTEQVNATLKFNITVNPEGRVVSVIPLQKASPGLERSVKEELLQNWRFNPLPANAPQKNQTGTITFRFRLE